VSAHHLHEHPAHADDHHDHMHAAHDHAGHSHGGHRHGGPDHGHAPSSFGPAFAIGTALNLGFVAVEIVYGVLSNSVALLADAGHNFGDGLGLLAAWIAFVLARRRPSRSYTFGLGKSSILAALFNALLLMAAVGAIAWEAVQRLIHPEPVAGTTVMVVATISIVVNGATALMFSAGRKGDLNVHAAFTHMVADAAVSAGVVVAGLVIAVTGWLWIDPAISLLLNLAILWGTWSILRRALGMVMAGVPHGTDFEAVRTFLAALPGVRDVHDLHIWPLSTTETALSCHLLIPAGHPGDQFLIDAAGELKTRFGIGHPTIQIEVDEALACPFAPDHVV
jgi:cobalt-zinc-cadmium efflux system protein